MEKNKKYGNKKDIAIVNSITALRFFASFLIITIFKTLGGISAAFFSGIFLLTDFIDGYLARKLKASTFFGALFDGITDKIYGIISYGLLMTINPLIFSIPLLIEIGIMLTQNKKYQNNQNIKSNIIGKVKTWFLSMSIVGSFFAIDALNTIPFLDYIKFYSLDKVENIKEHLILLGIQIPTIITQILTLKSYHKEIKQDNKSNLEKEIEIKEPLEDPNIVLQSIYENKKELEKKKTLLEKIKILKSVMFDPEYYEKNNEKPIRRLTRDLFK